MMNELTTTLVKRRTKQQFVYFIESRWTSFGAGLEYINEKEVVVPPARIIGSDWDYMGPLRFQPMAAIPILQFKGKEERYFADFQILAGVWILSAPLRSYFESIDAEAFDFRPCKTLMPDGSPGPERSLSLVTRSLIEALDREKSECKPNEYDSRGQSVSMSMMGKHYFHASAIGNAHFFHVPQAHTKVLVSQRVKDEFKKQGWRGASFTKAYLS
jgi:Protein of unknown function (DUF1629)